MSVYCVDKVETTNIPLGSKLLSAHQNKWLSPDGTFALKFYSRGPDEKRYSIGVVYNSVKDLTVAWTAGGNAQVGESASFELTLEGELVLRDLLSGAIMWKSNTSSIGVVGAAMRFDGNFVLLSKNSGVAWASFDNPTDTLLPGQRLNMGQILQAFSTDLKPSPYTAVLEASGNLSLTWEKNLTYWSSGTDHGINASGPIFASLQNSLFDFGLFNSSGQIKSWKTDDYTDANIKLRRVTLDTDGNLRIYGWSSKSLTWIVGWQALQNQCDVYGFCGAYGLCTYNSTGPTCICPASAGFVPIEAADPTKGCRRPQNLHACQETMTMVELDHTFLFEYPPYDQRFLAVKNDCNQDCLKNPDCVAVTAREDGSGTCLLKTLDSLSGYQYIPVASISFFKVCGIPPPAASASPSLSSSNHSSKISSVVSITASVFGTVVAVMLIQVALWCCFCREHPSLGGSSAQYTLLEFASGAPLQFSYKELQRATRNFKRRLGAGGFGTVYKGLLPNKVEVAVKQLEGVEQGEKQFRMEVAIIGSTHHVNLVRLYGFCAEGKHRLVVYEYLKNGSLDRLLFDVNSRDSPKLEWKTRFDILLGAARGISYLHHECRGCIIHCDIKPENILLDENFCAKVSDFGLAKLTHARDRPGAMTTVRGTRGYLAPEWRSNLPITVKSDVFSFGMVVLETISGRRNFDTSMSTGRRTFSEWAFCEYFERGCLVGVVDDRLEGQINMEELDRAMKVSFWCMQELSSLRPSMSKVVQILEGTLAVERPPGPTSLGALPTQDYWSSHYDDDFWSRPLESTNVSFR